MGKQIICCIFLIPSASETRPFKPVSSSKFYQKHDDDMNTKVFLIVLIASFRFGYSQKSLETLVMMPDHTQTICLSDTVRFRAFNVKRGSEIEWFANGLLKQTGGQDFIFKPDASTAKGASIEVFCQSKEGSVLIQKSVITKVSISPATIENLNLTLPVYYQNEIVTIDPGFSDKTYSWEWMWSWGNEACGYRVASFLAPKTNDQPIVLTVKDELGCPASKSFPIVIKTLPSGNAVSDSSFVCANLNSSSIFTISGSSLDQIQKAWTDSVNGMENQVKSIEKINPDKVKIHWKTAGFEGQTRVHFQHSLNVPIVTDILILNDPVPAPGRIYINSKDPEVILFEPASGDNFDGVVFCWKSAPKADPLSETIIRTEVGSKGNWCYVENLSSSLNTYWLELYEENSSCKCRRIIKLNY